MTDQNNKDPTNELEIEVPFIPFQTPFAKRICVIAGVKKIIQLQGMPISFYNDEAGVISEILNIGHFKNNSNFGEEVILTLAYNPKIQIEVHLCHDVTSFSGVFLYEKNDEDGKNDDCKKSFVTIGPDERLLCTPLGQLSDVMETEPEPNSFSEIKS